MHIYTERYVNTSRSMWLPGREQQACIGLGGTYSTHNAPNMCVCVCVCVCVCGCVCAYIHVYMLRFYVCICIYSAHNAPNKCVLVCVYVHIYDKAGLGIFETNVRIQWNPV